MSRLIEANVEPGKKTARAYFDAPGWAMAYTTNAWGWTAPGPGGPWGPFFFGGAWVCQHLWEHYSFTRDAAYLRRVYPVMKGAAEACLHMLLPDPAATSLPRRQPRRRIVSRQTRAKHRGCARGPRRSAKSSGSSSTTLPWRAGRLAWMRTSAQGFRRRDRRFVPRKSVEADS